MIFLPTAKYLLGISVIWGIMRALIVGVRSQGPDLIAGELLRLFAGVGVHGAMTVFREHEMLICYVSLGDARFLIPIANDADVLIAMGIWGCLRGLGHVRSGGFVLLIKDEESSTYEPFEVRPKLSLLRSLAEERGLLLRVVDLRGIGAGDPRSMVAWLLGFLSEILRLDPAKLKAEIEGELRGLFENGWEYARSSLSAR